MWMKYYASVSEFTLLAIGFISYVGMLTLLSICVGWGFTEGAKLANKKKK